MEYSWAPTLMKDVQLLTDKRVYSADEKISATLGFRLVGGLREAFHPDVWTVAWEDYDKIVRLTYGTSVAGKKGLRSRILAGNKKEVRRSSFYWSRDPDLPYRIWVMIMHEDGSAPKIPLNVEDARSKMLDVANVFEIEASSLGEGSHSLTGSAYARWGRRSFIEKGKVSGKSKPVVIKVE
jgi:hypothetical protein